METMLHRVDDNQVKPLLVAGREIILFEIRTEYRFQAGTLSELDHIWVRESDVVAEFSSSVIDRFLRQSHEWKGVPDAVWLQGRAVKPIPFMEAVEFWAQRAAAGSDQWATLVVRELERLEELVYNVFNGIEIPADQQWTLNYRDFDGRATAIANDSGALGPKMYRPVGVEVPA
jgi:hypothetical protein